MLQRYGFIEASTKSGKTYGALAWLVEQAWVFGRPGRNYWWIAPVYAQARIAYRRLKRALKPKDVFSFHDTELTVTLANGAVIWFKSAEKPDNLYGEDVYAAVVDEASRVKEESWFAVRSTLTYTRGPVRAIGNVRGKRNWFYKLCRIAEGGRSGMVYSKITAYDAIAAGVLDELEIADAKATLPELLFRELYLAEAAPDGGNPFGYDAIQRQKMTEEEFQQARLETVPVSFGVDLGRAQDWTVVIGLNARGQVCVFDRFQMPWTESKNRIASLVKSTPTLVDMTGVGDGVVEDLQRGGYGGNYQGFRFTGASKQPLMESLARAIQGAEVWFPDSQITDELEEFGFEYSARSRTVLYTVPEGMHDDCVDALALAVRNWRGQAGWYMGPIRDAEDDLR